jgi:hypothetical protein
MDGRRRVSGMKLAQRSPPVMRSCLAFWMAIKIASVITSRVYQGKTGRVGAGPACFIRASQAYFNNIKEEFSFRPTWSSDKGLGSTRPQRISGSHRLGRPCLLIRPAWPTAGVNRLRSLRLCAAARPWPPSPRAPYPTGAPKPGPEWEWRSLASKRRRYQ